jgi:hypothetical protein
MIKNITQKVNKIVALQQRIIYNSTTHKENIMFTFETLVDTYAKNARAALAYVQPEAVKTALLDLTDKQVEFSKSFAKQVESVTEYVTNNAKETAAKFFPNK